MRIANGEHRPQSVQREQPRGELHGADEKGLPAAGNILGTKKSRLEKDPDGVIPKADLPLFSERNSVVSCSL